MHGRIRDSRDLGRAVQTVRLAHGLTQVELAARLGVSQRGLSELETGKPKILRDRLFDVLAKLGVRLSFEADDA